MTQTVVSLLHEADGAYTCIVTHIARVWINRVRLPISRDGFGNPVPRQSDHFHTQAESGVYLRDSSRVPGWRPYIYFKPPYAIGSVPSLSGHAFAYLWRSLSRVHRPRASNPQGRSERVLPWQVTMDQLIYASLSHTFLLSKND